MTTAAASMSNVTDYTTDINNSTNGDEDENDDFNTNIFCF